MSSYYTKSLGTMMTPPLAPPGAQPGFWHPPVTALPGGTSGGYQMRAQCENVGGRYEEHCRHMGPTMMPQPGLPAHIQLPNAGKLCQRYCHLPSGESASYHEPDGRWSPNLQAISGLGEEKGSVAAGFGIMMLLGVGALVYYVATAETPAQKRKRIYGK
jgi:hypothetical protein